MTQCPCNPKALYAECCEQYISGKESPTTPEQLMRSRYTAYTQANSEYIAATMKSPASNNFDKTAASRWAKRVSWLELEVIKSYNEDKNGYVEFIARFREGVAMQQIHELSTFHFIENRWYYVDGLIME